MMNFQTPNELINFQATLAKSVFAYVPQGEVRDRLVALTDANVALMTAFANASTVYGETVKAKILAV